MVNVRDYKFIYMDHKIYVLCKIYFDVHVQKKKKDDTGR